MGAGREGARVPRSNGRRAETQIRRGENLAGSNRQWIEKVGNGGEWEVETGSLRRDGKVDANHGRGMSQRGRGKVEKTRGCRRLFGWPHSWQQLQLANSCIASLSTTTPYFNSTPTASHSKSGHTSWQCLGDLTTRQPISGEAINEKHNVSN